MSYGVRYIVVGC